MQWRLGGKRFYTHPNLPRPHERGYTLIYIRIAYAFCIPGLISKC